MKRYQKFIVFNIKMIFILCFIFSIVLISYFIFESYRFVRDINNPHDYILPKVIDFFENFEVPKIGNNAFELNVILQHFNSSDYDVHRIDLGDNILNYKHILTYDIKSYIDDDDFLIYIFGASSLLSSHGFNNEGYIFSSLLEDNLLYEYSDLKVINYGLPGLESSTVNGRVYDSINFNRPDMVILYFGHNDYTRTYMHFLDFYSDFFDLLNIVFLRRSAENFSRYNMDLIRRLSNFMIKISLLDIDSNDFKLIDDMILERYIDNVENILLILREKNIPVIYMTTIGNLHLKPYGDLSTKNYYDAGINSESYHERIKYLRKAVDSEIFTFPKRAPSALNSYIKSLNYPNTHILDLEEILINKNFEFDNNDFTNYLHFAESTHRLISDIIFEFILENSLLNSTNILYD